MELGQESPGPDEPQQIALIANLISDLQKKEFAPGVKPMRRDAHGKHHGVVRAELTVDRDLPPELAQGLFSEPKVYAAYVRFSNGEGRVHHDKKKDARGMAIKVLGVSGAKLLEDERDAQTQDFLMITHHTFFVRKLLDYVSFANALAGGNPLSHFFGWNPFAWRYRELGLVMKTMVVISNPLTKQYWTTVPFLFGEGRAAKFSMRPHKLENKGAPSAASSNYLREAMVDTLQNEDVYFDFLVQLQTDAATMPIEDSTVEWSEAASPYRKVATLRIPKQRFDRPEQHTLAENLSFTPWHSIKAHRPLGPMNRCRKLVYTTISKLRHEHNGVRRMEPDGTEIPTA